jgi:signal transduction histidine kinase
MRRYRVLIVDDDAVDRRLYCRLLAHVPSDECVIEQAHDGAGGLMKLRGDHFDCVLLDFRLPDMTGLEFVAAASLDGELPCAVMLVTGQGSESLAVEAMKRGVQDYLVKEQITGARLWQAVTSAVGQMELRRRLAQSLRELTEANAALEQEVSTRRAAEVELVAAKEAAEQASQSKTRFVAMITHELRTPLNGILGYAQILRLEGGLTARQDTQVNAMMQAGRHLLQMIERVLDFASIDSGRMHLRPELVSLPELVDTCIAVVRPTALERGLGLSVFISPDAPPRFETDPGRLRQVLLNLLGNALKYTDVGNVELRLLAGTTPGALRIEVADSGRGIDASKRLMLFQEFERLDIVATVEGTGLGLAIAARIVRLMGGEINHSANPTAANPTGGSVFWFELPAAAGTAPRPSEFLAGAAGSAGERVLLVDDIKINLDIIGAFLKASGRTVVLATDGQEAVRIAAAQRLDLILMDVRMPEMDGLEATRRIRALSGRNGQVPILALTAYASLDQIGRCLDAGMDGHVPKPVDYKTLIRAIEHILSQVPPDRRDGTPDEAGQVSPAAPALALPGPPRADGG